MSKGDTVKLPRLKLGHNPALLPWPSDPWGLTVDLRRVVTTLGARVGAHADKKELIDKTLEIAAGFLEARYAEEVRQRDEADKATKTQETQLELPV